LNFSITRVIVRRFFELFFTNAAISAVLTVFNIADLLITANTLLKGMCLGIALFIFFNVRMLKNCYFDLRNKALYYFTNLSAYFAFMAVCFGTYFLCSGEVYTWLFAVTKFAKYTRFTTAVPYSALIFHCFGIIMIFLAPLGMSWVFPINDDTEEV